MQSFAAAVAESAAARQLYYFTYDQWKYKRLPFPIARRELHGEDCKELLPVILRISRVLAKVRTTTYVLLESDRLGVIDLESDLWR